MEGQYDIIIITCHNKFYFSHDFQHILHLYLAKHVCYMSIEHLFADNKCTTVFIIHYSRMYWPIKYQQRNIVKKKCM